MFEETERQGVFVCVAVVIQHAKRVRHIIWLSVACPAQPCFFFSHYFIKATIFWKKNLNVKYVLILSPLLPNMLSYTINLQHLI